MSIPQKDSSSYIFGAPRNHLDAQDLPSKYPMWNLAQTIQRSVGVVNLATKLVSMVLESRKSLPTSGIWIINCHNLRVTMPKSIEKKLDLVALTRSDVAIISSGDSQNWIEISSNLQTMLAHDEEQKLLVKGEGGVIILVRVRFQIKKPVTQPEIVKFSWYTRTIDRSND